jgi:hypothetical protein
LKAFLEIIESVVSSPFVKAEADSAEYFVLCLKRYVRLQLCNMFIGIMKIQIWSYLYKNVTNPEKNMSNK